MPTSSAPAPVTGMPSVLAQVRQATRATHEALDALLPLGLRNLRDYRRYLGAMLPLAEWLAHGPHPDRPAHLAAWDDPRRLACLRADCAELDVRPGPCGKPPPAGWAHWLGGCYVIEGSALGARLLSRHAAELAREHAGVRDARRFLGHVTADPPRWKRFVHLLESLPGGHAAAATSGARDGFAIVHARLATGESRA